MTSSGVIYESLSVDVMMSKLISKYVFQEWIRHGRQVSIYKEIWRRLSNSGKLFLKNNIRGLVDFSWAITRVILLIECNTPDYEKLLMSK